MLMNCETPFLFRAYQNGSMWYNTGNMWDGEFTLCISSKKWEIINIKKNDPYSIIVASSENGDILMQHTGKYDINNVEIYVGDIVKHLRQCFDWDKPEGEEEYFREEIGVVKYVDHGFWIEAKKYSENFGWEGEDLWNWNKLEVIGNIHENLDLLPIEK